MKNFLEAPWRPLFDPPPEYEKANVVFMFYRATPQIAYQLEEYFSLRRIMEERAKTVPRNDYELHERAQSDQRLQDQAASLLESLFFKPAREGDYKVFSKHLRKLFEVVKRFHISANGSLVYELDRSVLDTPEYHFFIAFERLRRKPLFAKKWPSRTDVRKLAIQSWALHELDKKGSSIKFDTDLPANEDALVQDEIKKLVKKVPKRIWENTGLKRLEKDGLGRPKGSTKRIKKRAR